MPKLDSFIQPVNKTTIQEEIYKKLCTLILEGNIVPGDTITVSKFAKAFDVSPMPVREALARLTASGAIDVISGRSMGIPSLTVDKLNDITKVRLEIEPLALTWAYQNIDSTFKSNVSGLLEKLKKAEQDNDVQEYIRTNYYFHMALYEKSNSSSLNSIISRLWIQINPYFYWLKESNDYKMSNNFHEKIYESMINKDIDLACDFLRQDLKHAYSKLYEKLTA